VVFFENSTTQTLTIRTHTHPYEYAYANSTSMSTSEGSSTSKSGDSRSHQWRIVVDGNVAYHLTHNAGSVPLDCPTIGVQAQSLHKWSFKFKVCKMITNNIRHVKKIYHESSLFSQLRCLIIKFILTIQII
jgi:hypothetical protein